MKINDRFIRQGNALILTVIILALVTTTILAVTNQLFGEQKLAAIKRSKLKAQDAADCITSTLLDRMKLNVTKLMVDVGSPDNSIDSWISRGNLDLSNRDITNGIWINDCLVYWRLEPVSCIDRTAVNAASATSITDADAVTAGATQYMVNNVFNTTANPAPRALNSRTYNLVANNPGNMLFELTVDAYAMVVREKMYDQNQFTNQDQLNISPVGTNSAPNPSLAVAHVQKKSRVISKTSSLFRWIILYKATGPSGDLELEIAPPIAVLGDVHTNGAAYLGNNQGMAIFGSHPELPDINLLDNIPALRHIRFTTIDGLFKMVKTNNLRISPSYADPQFVPLGTPENPAYISPYAPCINSATLQLTNVSFATTPPITLQAPIPLSTSSVNPLTEINDSRVSSNGTPLVPDPSKIPLLGYDKNEVRDGGTGTNGGKVVEEFPNSGIYRPLEPFQLVKQGAPLKGGPGTYSINAGLAIPFEFATDMILFKQAGPLGLDDIKQTQVFGPINTTTANALPLPASGSINLIGNGVNINADQAALTLPAPIAPFTVFPAGTPPGIIIPPGSKDARDLFSNLATYVNAHQNNTFNGSPVLGNYIKNSLGLNPEGGAGSGITILERGTQLGLTYLAAGAPGGVRGANTAMTWEPPSPYSGIGAARFYDVNNDNVVTSAGDGPGNFNAYLQDYCIWMRSNYVVYFGLNSAGTLIDITNQFFSVPAGATDIDSLLAHEDAFKDRRESRWFQSPLNGYTSRVAAAYINNFNNLRVNTITLNIGAINNFIATTPLSQLDGTGIGPVSTHFNGAIYVARTPRYYANIVAPAATDVLGSPTRFTYQRIGMYHPLMPLGYNPLQTSNNALNQILPQTFLTDGVPIGAPAALYPIVGSSLTASVNNIAGLAIPFGSSPNDSWSAYPLLKRVRITNGATINWGGTKPGRVKGLTIYTPNACYLQGNFNITEGVSSSGYYPACALYCDSLTALSNNWSDTNANALINPDYQVYTRATDTIYRLCVVLHSTPTDRSNIIQTSPFAASNANEAAIRTMMPRAVSGLSNGQPLTSGGTNDITIKRGSGGIGSVIKFLERWTGRRFALIGSIVVQDRARYTRANNSGSDVYEGPTRYLIYNDDLRRELPPFPEFSTTVDSW